MTELMMTTDLDVLAREIGARRIQQACRAAQSAIEHARRAGARGMNPEERQSTDQAALLEQVYQ